MSGCVGLTFAMTKMEYVMVSFDLPDLQKEKGKIRTNRVQRDPASPGAQ